MTLYRIGDVEPQLGEGAWVAPSADVIGDVRLGRRASIWFGAILRGDNTPLLLGDETNFQDGAIAHSDKDYPLTIGARVTIGHQAILHGCTIADDCLVGMGAKILNGAVLESDCIVGAAALITEGKRFESGSLIIGSPARAIRQLTQEERKMLRASAAHYAAKAARYCSDLKITG